MSKAWLKAWKSLRHGVHRPTKAIPDKRQKLRAKQARREMRERGE